MVCEVGVFKPAFGEAQTGVRTARSNQLEEKFRQRDIIKTAPLFGELQKVRSTMSAPTTFPRVRQHQATMLAVLQQSKTVGTGLSQIRRVRSTRAAPAPRGVTTNHRIEITEQDLLKPRLFIQLTRQTIQASVEGVLHRL